MAQIAGITVETSYKGTPKTITFDFKKYGDLLSRFFKNEGIDLPYSPYNEKETKKLLRIKSNIESGKRKKVEMLNFWD